MRSNEHEGPTREAKTGFSSLEVCAGAGGMSLGLERAGFDPVLLIDEDDACAATLFANRPGWSTETIDLLDFTAAEHEGCYDVDLLAAGLPRLRGNATVARTDDEYEQRLCRATALLAAEVGPKAVLIENVPGLVDKPQFGSLRRFIHDELEHLGYKLTWGVLNAVDFGVPQFRPHGFVVALRPDYVPRFEWPIPPLGDQRTVGGALFESMSSRGWPFAREWAARAERPAPTIVGGSKNRGGPDLGPSGSRKAWAGLGVNGGSIGDEAPGPDHGNDLVKLTVRQVALLQGFPPDWRFSGRKTAAYRQVGHALPPPLAHAVGESIARALRGAQPTSRVTYSAFR